MPKHTASVSTLALGLVVGLGLGLGAVSCKSKATHCHYAEGDATCQAEFGAGYYCLDAEAMCEGFDQNLGCVDTQPPDECWSPCGEDGCGMEAESSTDATDSTDSTSETTEETATSTDATSEETGPQPCTGNSECTDPSAPFCAMGMCVGCADASEGACADLDEATPVCDEGNNTCVQCLPGNAAACSGTTPVCDEATSSCVGCEWHDECPGTACRMKTGECFPDNVYEAMDVTKLQGLIDEIPAEGGVITLTSGGISSVTVPAGVVVAILGEGAEWAGNSNPALTVETQAEVYVQEVRIAGTQTNMGWGIDVDGELWLDRSEVVNNVGGGVRVSGGAVIRNSFVGTAVGSDPLEIGGTAEIRFTTVGAGFGNTRGLRCVMSGMAVVTNSLLASGSVDPVVQCPNATITNSAIEMQAIGDNVMLGDMDTAWFANFANGDFHLSGTHPAEIDTAAIWQPGDPLVDIDGESRPQDQTPTAAGADLP